LILLGSTGSIGVNSLIVAKEFNIDIEVLSAGRNIKKLNEQIAEFNPNIVVVSNEEDVQKVAHKNVYFGINGIKQALDESSCNLVLNAIVGFAGVIPTIYAIELNKTVALANKESLVVAGNMIDMSKIRVIDSEHFGLWYLFSDKKIKKMTITASGGAFRDYGQNDLKNATIKDALCHPSWSMGSKITIDSATMTNKLFELLEAKWLFGITNLDAIIETKSIIHAMIDFEDGSTTAHIAKPDMKLPIAFAMIGKVEQNMVEHIDFTKIEKLEFKKINKEKYPIWGIKDDLLENPNMGVVVNAANEVAVDAFLNSKIPFLDISKNTIKTYQKFEGTKHTNINEIVSINHEVREYALSICK
jgi:1-deoxy-D-xylulose-5-phosphate reductoisomerase